MDFTFIYNSEWYLIKAGTHYIKKLPPRTSLFIKENENSGESLYAHNKSYKWQEYSRPIALKTGRLYQFREMPENA